MGLASNINTHRTPLVKNAHVARWWWTPLIPVLREAEAGGSQFQNSHGYTEKLFQTIIRKGPYLFFLRKINTPNCIKKNKLVNLQTLVMISRMYAGKLLKWESIYLRVLAVSKVTKGFCGTICTSQLQCLCLRLQMPPVVERPGTQIVSWSCLLYLVLGIESRTWHALPLKSFFFF